MAKARIRMGLNSLMTSVSEENVNARDSKGWAPIHYMAGCGTLKHIEYLVSLGADLNSMFNKSWGDQTHNTTYGSHKNW